VLEGVRYLAEPVKIALPPIESLEYVHIADIIRCEAGDNYTYIYFSNRKKIVVSRTLAIYEELLTGKGFARIHYQHLTNLHHVERYVQGRGGIVIMSDKKVIQVSQRKKEEFLKLIGAK
jgi:two-component system, LytTR family, response regulator